MKMNDKRYLLAVVALLFVMLATGVWGLTAGEKWGEENINKNFTKRVWIDSTLNVDGATATTGLTNTGALTNTGNATITGNLTVTGNTTLTGTPTFTGNQTVNGNLTCTGTLTAEHVTSTDDATVTDDLAVGGDIATTGSVTVVATVTAEQLTSSDDATVTDDLAVGGDATVTGAVTGATLVGARTVTTVTTDTVLTAAQCKYGIVLLAAAQDDTTVTLTVPSVAAGWDVIFVDADTDSGADMRISMGTGDTINGGTAAKDYVHGGGSTAKGVAHFATADAVDLFLLAPALEAGAAESTLPKWRNDNS